MIVVARAGVLGEGWGAAATPWAWAAVIVSALTTLANAASRSRAERALFLPIAIGMLATSMIVVLA